MYFCTYCETAQAVCCKHHHEKYKQTFVVVAFFLPVLPSLCICYATKSSPTWYQGKGKKWIFFSVAISKTITQNNSVVVDYC